MLLAPAPCPCSVPVVWCVASEDLLTSHTGIPLAGKRSTEALLSISTAAGICSEYPRVVLSLPGLCPVRVPTSWLLPCQLILASAELSPGFLCRCSSLTPPENTSANLHPESFTGKRRLPFPRKPWPIGTTPQVICTWLLFPRPYAPVGVSVSHPFFRCFPRS